MSTVVTDSVDKRDGRTTESEVATEVIVDEARKEDVVEHAVAQDVTATYDETEPQDRRLRHNLMTKKNK